MPAILSGKRVVISTGTKNLQEQLFYKDIPFLQKHFERPLQVCYMKGRNNFACRQKIYDADKQPILNGLEEIADFQIIREWEKTTDTGDRAEIKTLPESSSAWLKVDARRDLCTGQKCQQFERCFLTLMHQRAHESDIIIVNHHLFFADLAVKDEDFGGIIPEYAAVVFDEAHEIEDVVGQILRRGRQQLSVPGTGARRGRGIARQAVRIIASWTGSWPRWTIARSISSRCSERAKAASASRATSPSLSAIRTSSTMFCVPRNWSRRSFNW